MLKAQLSVASSKAVIVEERIESQTDIVIKYYFQISRKKADYKLFFQRLLQFLRSQKLGDNYSNRIYNKILDRDWFSAHLFVMESACNHVGVQFERFVIEYL